MDDWFLNNMTVNQICISDLMTSVSVVLASVLVVLATNCTPQWGTADAEIKVPSIEKPEL